MRHSNRSPADDAEPAISGRELESFWYRSIAMTRAMQLEVAALDAAGISLRAPLAPNANDKGTAFAGSLNATMTLAGWGWIWWRTRAGPQPPEIVIASGEQSFRRPVRETIAVRCESPETADLERFLAQLRRRDKARLTLQACTVLAGGEDAARLRADYVAYR